MPSHRFAFLSTFLLASMAAAISCADIVSVTFDNTAAGSTPHFEATEIAGAPGVRVSNWNVWQQDIEGATALTGLVDVAGNSTGVEATVTASNWSQRGTVLSDDPQMFRGVIDIFTTETIEVTGISYDQYDVYLYMHNDGADRAGSFSIDGTTYYVRGGLSNPDANGDGYVLSTDTTVDLTNPNSSDVDNSIDQGNYVRFTGLTGSNFTLVAGAVDTSSGANRNKFSGFQIVNTTAVPEPTAVSLLGLFGLSLVGLRRKA